MHSLQWKPLARYRGHFYNWYDTQSLKPLQPRYVSTVDSGNLAAHLLALRQGLLALPDHKIVHARSFDGLSDTLQVLVDALEAEESTSRRPLTQPSPRRGEDAQKSSRPSQRRATRLGSPTSLLNFRRTWSPRSLPHRLRSRLHGCALINWQRPPRKRPRTSIPLILIPKARQRGGHMPLPRNARPRVTI